MGQGRAGRAGRQRRRKVGQWASGSVGQRAVACGSGGPLAWPRYFFVKWDDGLAEQRGIAAARRLSVVVVRWFGGLGGGVVWGGCEEVELLSAEALRVRACRDVMSL
ncbi:hypothetical protein PLESTF_001120100 [Pleodorina starrii]|nr:hypothetical protein PLESTF_001120100 [Pleodorina starrii]